jgi:hypothetical protein
MAVVDTLKPVELSEGTTGPDGQGQLPQSTVSKEALANEAIPPHKKIPNGTDLPNGTSIDVVEVPSTPASGADLYVGKTDFKPEDRGIDEVRSLRVVVIGAGLSGVLAAILLPVKVPKIDLVIYEKNEDVVSDNF